MTIRQEFHWEQHELVRELSIDSLPRRTSIVRDTWTDGTDATHAWWGHVLRGSVPTIPSVLGEVRSVDLFSSVGGLSLGLGFAAAALQLRHRPLLAIDIDDAALAVYEANFPGAMTLSESVTNVADVGVRGRGSDAVLAYPPEVIHETLASLVGQVDIVLAGPPCQGHSTLNNRTRHEDPRNRLYLEAIGAAVALDAPLIIIENVPTVRNDRDHVVETAKSVLRHAGYRYDDHVIAGDKIGAPQSRKRHFLIASRLGDPSIAMTLAALAAPPMTLRQAIEDLVDMRSSFLDEPPQLSEENHRRIDYLFASNTYELPDAQRPECHRDGHTYPSVYGRLYWDQPSPTITTGYMTPGRGRFIHPSQKRTITAHEAARIQGFPDSFDFRLPGGEIPSRKQLAKWIGDAVPSQLGFAAGLCALACSPTHDDVRATETGALTAVP